MIEFTSWTRAAAAAHIAVPTESDDKYSRGVLGLVTGSEQYPGAAVLGVEAALRTGVGMVRYRGPARASDLVLHRRPEVVVSGGRVQAWVLGSGFDPVERDTTLLDVALADAVPTVLDGRALDLRSRATGPVVMTPHYRELARVVGVEPAEVAADPAGWAVRASDRLGATILLKGHTTFVVGHGEFISVRAAPSWLATAGAGDALGGILGALVATHADAPELLPRLAATAALIHGLAAERASAGGPLVIMDLCEAIPAVIADLLRTGSD